jgi:hypothetical protein
MDSSEGRNPVKIADRDNEQGGNVADLLDALEI